MKYTFFFHYNKPASQKLGKPQLSVHYRDVCHIVDGVDCKVAIKSRNRSTQPRCVMSGRAESVHIENGVALIS